MSQVFLASDIVSVNCPVPGCADKTVSSLEFSDDEWWKSAVPGRFDVGNELAIVFKYGMVGCFRFLIWYSIQTGCTGTVQMLKLRLGFITHETPNDNACYMLSSINKIQEPDNTLVLIYRQ